jgi:tetratricopeptide (TPR) repeat protein
MLILTLWPGEVRADAAADEANKGKEALERGEVKEARLHFTKAIELDPHNADYHYLRGSAYVGSGNENRTAIQDLTEAVRLRPKYREAFFLRALAYSLENDSPKALSDYNEVVRIDPTYGLGYWERGKIKYGDKDYSGAVADFAEVKRLMPKRELGYYGLAFVNSACPDPKYRDGKKALEYATSACDLTASKNGYCLAILAAAKAELGEFGDAIKWQKKAIESLPSGLEDIKKMHEKRLEAFENRKPLRAASMSKD